MSKKPNGFEKPNHTQTPNSFFDEVMKDIDTMAELKVTLAIIRQTIGWHRKRVRFGVGKIERLTGLARNSVISGAEAAEARGTIRRIETIGEAEWELVIQDTPSTVEGADFEGDAIDEGDPPQDLTQNPSTVEGHKRKKEIIKEKIDIEDAKIFTALSEMTGGGLNSNTPKFVDAWKEKHELARILQAIGIAKEKKARSLKYVDEILIGWEANGYPKTREERVNDKRANGNGKHPPPPTEDNFMEELAEKRARLRAERQTA